MKLLTAVVTIALIAAPPPSDAWQTATIESHDPCGGPSVQLSFSQAELINTFADVYRMSDGSRPTPPVPETNGTTQPFHPRALDRTIKELGAVDAIVSPDGSSVHLCEKSLLKLAMLGALGNFVKTAGDDSVAGVGSTATVVVDVYTGSLVVVPPYSTTREYFLETLLVISIVAIARLSMDRTVVVGTVGATK